MKFLLPALAVAGLLIQPALADLVIIQKVEQSGGQMPDTEMTVRIKGTKVRADVGEQLSTIVDSDGGDLVSLMHGQKTAMAMPSAAIEAMKAQMAPKEGEVETPDLKPTGKTEEINGFKCEEYAGKFQGADVSYWVTKDIDNQQAILDQLAKLSGDADPFKGAFKKGEGFPGFPIRTEIEAPGAGKTVVTVVSVEEKALADSDFEIPADYKKMEMPKIPGMN